MGDEREGVELLPVVLVVFGGFDEVHREPRKENREIMCQ